METHPESTLQAGCKPDVFEPLRRGYTHQIRFVRCRCGCRAASATGITGV